MEPLIDIPDAALSSKPEDLKQHALAMIEWFKDQYPQAKEIEIEVKFSPYARVRMRQGKLVEAYVSVNQEVRCAYIKLALKGRIVLTLLSTVAHEFCHILQALAIGKPIGYHLPTHPIETAADRFGKRERNRYINSWVMRLSENHKGGHFNP